MPGQFFKNILTKDNQKETSLQKDFSKLADGLIRTDSYSTTAPVSLVGLVDDNGVRQSPGFTPNSSFNRTVLPTVQPAFPPAIPNGWYGNLLDSHIDSVNFNKRKTIATEDKFNESNNFSDDKSTRDRYLIFNDSSQDYFRHGLAINGRTPIKTAKNDREAWDGSNDREYRLKTFKNTPYENEDPVMYGFEIIIDALSSPLLNGSIEDFISQYGVVAEIQSRKRVLYDFKRQFEKIFKTNGSIFYATQPSDPLQSSANNAYAQAQNQKGLFRPGRKAYLSHYLQKIDGLDFLIERNDGSPESKGSFVNYGTDKLTLSFTEDLTGTMATIAHLYKLLYWSRANGKNIIPENLLRFNCEIVVCEVRNFNRVRKIVQGSPSVENLEIIKDNVSRYIYSLRECQFFFNQMSHEKSIDLSNIKMFGDAGPGYDVIMNFKYSTTKFERWVPDPELFGQYVGYNNGAIWKIGNKGAREERSTQGGSTGNIVDTSNPRFYTVGTNTIRHNGVTTAIVLDKISISPEDIDTNTNIGTAGANSVSGSSAAIGALKGLQNISTNKKAKSTDELGEDEQFTGPKSTKSTTQTQLDKFKEGSKKVANNLVKNAQNFVVGEINNQIKIRAKLLENTINKVKNSLGLGGLSGVKNVYPKPYTPHGFGPWFDVRNELFNFLTEDLANSMANAKVAANPTAYPNIEQLNKFKPTNNGKSTNTIYTEKTKYKDIGQVKFGNSNENNKFYGTLDNIIKTKSNPSEHQGKIWKPIGEKDFSKIGFGISNKGDHQKYPEPLSVAQNIIGIGIQKLKTDTGYYTKLKYGLPRSFPNTINYGTLENIIKTKSNPSQPTSTGGNVVWKPIGQKDFSKIGFGPDGYGDHQKYPAPITQNSKNLEDIVKSNTKWSYPNNDKKFGKK